MRRIPRAFRVLSILRDCIGDDVDQGKYVAFATDPEGDGEAEMYNELHSPRQRKIVAYALDSYIRSAAESSDLVETYIAPLGPIVQDKVRAPVLPVQNCIAFMGARFDWDEAHTGKR